jgi:hypothetical protein
MMQRYVTDLQCLRCRTQRLHTVTYLGNVLASVSCSVCGATLRPAPDRLLADYVRDFELRLIRKPGRMLHQARRHPISFVFHYLPRGLVSKPREVLEEWGALARTSQEVLIPAQDAAARGARACRPQ